jgi:hypothetical protein
MRNERGLSLTGLLLVSVVLIALALLGFKLFPAYAEYLTVKKALSEIVHNPEYRSSTREIQAAFERRVTIDNIKAVGSKDLEITKQGDSVSVSASWSVKVPLLYNLSACMDFEARGE